MEPADEVETRVSLWEASQWEQLLRRIEEQKIIVSRVIRKRQTSFALDDQRRFRKAKHISAEGAYRKAAQSLTSEMMTYAADEDLQHANELLPNSCRSDGIFTSARPPDSQENPDIIQAEHASWSDAARDKGGPLNGVRYSALVAPGPSGTRPEHIKEMLGIRRRGLANSLLKSQD